MNSICIWTALAAASVIAPATGQTVRIGTFHKAAIVVAYYRSPQWAEVMNAKLAEQRQAKAANDTQKLQELERWGSGHQETSHKQLAGEAPIDNIVEALKPAFAEIARAAQAAAIAADLPYAGPGVQTVDVTGLLLDWLKADERTRAIVKDVRSNPTLH